MTYEELGQAKEKQSEINILQKSLEDMAWIRDAANVGHECRFMTYFNGHDRRATVPKEVLPVILTVAEATLTEQLRQAEEEFAKL